MSDPKCKFHPDRIAVETCENCHSLVCVECKRKKEISTRYSEMLCAPCFYDSFIAPRPLVWKIFGIIFILVSLVFFFLGISFIEMGGIFLSIGGLVFIFIGYYMFFYRPPIESQKAKVQKAQWVEKIEDKEILSKIEYGENSNVVL
ncbi:hypothetical protein NEF87_002481 [Candidatus Lokiarchaeum ossiferum]|uniref:B box-type domain-containing protein n=1 Tax=Candidatus Lokiarchaeum ossiferum TaxID=2951803 RepID=A0ABY6HRR3_9ARCH|nr:hypothetical protein NEF87_002481 [Candidatus Lokiarchaeum sp. B-35]